MAYKRYAVKLHYEGNTPPFSYVVTAKDAEHAVTIAKYESTNRGWPREEPITFTVEEH